MQTWALISSSQVTLVMSKKAELRTTHPRSSTSVPMLRIDAIERVEAPRLSESSTKTGYVYTFGAPGHGKGPFDGYGGSFKNKIHSLISKSYSQTGSIPGTRTGFINEVRDVFDALVYYYEKGIGRQAQANIKTDEFKFFLYEIGEDTAVPTSAG